MNKATLLSLAGALPLAAAFALPLHAATAIEVPNASFEAPGKQYAHPTDWKEATKRGVDHFQYSSTHKNGEIKTLIADDGEQFAAVGLSTEGTGAIRTADSVGTFEANTVYTLTVSIAQSLTQPPEGIAYAGFLANNQDAGTEELNLNMTFEDSWMPITCTVSTAEHPDLVGKKIDLIIGWKHLGQYVRNLYFDNVKLTSEPATAAPAASTEAAPPAKEAAPKAE